MKTLYSACLSRLGLSQADAARLHRVRLETVKGWSAGRGAVPQSAWDCLRLYEMEIVTGSNDLRDRWEAAGEPEIEIDDEEAGGLPLMATADLVLTTSGPLFIGQTTTSEMALHARKPRKLSS